MLPLFLIIILSLYVVRCVVFMFKREDDLSAYAFIILYVYMVFAQVGYVFFPELSDLMGAYFGEVMFYRAWLFMFLSFVSCFWLYRRFALYRSNSKVIYTVRPQSGRKVLFYSFLVLLCLWVYFYFYTHRASFGWGQEHSMGDGYFVLSFRLFQTSTLILYASLRQKFSFNKLLLFIACAFIYLQVDVAAGARSDLLYAFVGVLFFELYPFVQTVRYNKKKLVLFGILGVLFIQVLLALLEVRATGSISLGSLIGKASAGSDNDIPAFQKILAQDYYSPSHTLFLAIKYHFIHPFEVVRSNIANIIIGSNYPYLTSEIVGLINGSLSRHEGWGFHLFVEGYCFMGMFGFIYNGIVWNALMIILHKFVQTNNAYIKRCMIMICSITIISMMRSQSSQSLQNFVFTLVPAIILLSFAFDSGIKILRTTYKMSYNENS